MDLSIFFFFKSFKIFKNDLDEAIAPDQLKKLKKTLDISIFS